MKIWIRNQQKHILSEQRRIRKAAQRILADLALHDAELSILLVNDAQIRGLNRLYLKKDKPTNILAFPMRAGEYPTLHPHLLGDLVISVETAQRQCKRFGLHPTQMIILLLVHGILHLVGYEHEGSKKGAQEMALKQRELFQKVMKTGILE
ncbi:MAG: rRNA maturation RNase YbeY [Thermodesulfobacteriota bacterium]